MELLALFVLVALFSFSIPEPSWEDRDER